jgi:hypothetical protein
MTARELLGVLIRAAGLGLIFCALFDLMHLLGRALGVPTTTQYPTATIAAAVAEWVVLGLVIIVSANLIVRLVYGRDR